MSECTKKARQGKARQGKARRGGAGRGGAGQGRAGRGGAGQGRAAQGQQEKTRRRKDEKEPADKSLSAPRCCKTSNIASSCILSYSYHRSIFSVTSRNWCAHLSTGAFSGVNAEVRKSRKSRNFRTYNKNNMKYMY